MFRNHELVEPNCSENFFIRNSSFQVATILFQSQYKYSIVCSSTVPYHRSLGPGDLLGAEHEADSALQHAYLVVSQLVQ